MYQFKRQEPLDNNADLTSAGSSSFKYKSSLLGNSEPINGNINPNIPQAHRLWKYAKIIVPLKYISSFFRSLEILLINTKVHIELNYSKNSIISNNAGATSFKITKTELYVPVVTLNTQDNNKLNQLLDTEFKRKVYWNEYKSKIETITQAHNDNNYKRSFLDANIPGLNKLFVMGFNNNAVKNQVLRNSHRKYFLPRVDIKDYNALIDGRNFYDQNISDDFKKYEELRKIMTGKGEDYTTVSLLDYDCWKNNYKFICCDSSKQKVLDSNPIANQQIEFIYKLDNSTNPANIVQILAVLEKEKETNLEFTKGMVKVHLYYKMVQYNKIDLHLTKLQLEKIQDAVKNNNGTTIRLSNKNFNKNQ